MLYYQACLSLLSVISCTWIVIIYLLREKIVFLDDCIKDNLNNTSNLIECYNKDYNFPTRAIYFCLSYQISFTFLIFLLTMLSCIGDICIRESCSYGVEIHITSLNREEMSPSSEEGSGLVSKDSDK